MTPQERAGMASAINEAIARECAALRADHAAELEALRVMADNMAASFERRADAAEAHVARIERELSEPVLRDAFVDAAGDLRIVQRNGDAITVRIADLPAIIAAAVSERSDDAEARLGARLDSNVARALMRLGDAPRWSRVAAYGPGAVVACYNGRTYELCAGVKASIGQEPGDSPDVWQRIGFHGLRVMKAKPATVEAGDLFTDNDSKFFHDGETTTLLVAKPVKHSDVESRVKPIALQLQVAMDRVGNAERAVEAVRADLRLVSPLAKIADKLDVLAREEFRA